VSVTWLYAIGSVILVSLVSLLGIIAIAIREQRLKRVIFVLVSLAVGGLFGDVFIHLLPEAFEKFGATLKTSLYVLAGIFTFFGLEKFLRWRHEYSVSSGDHIHPVGYLNLFADGLHNLIDGMLIGASYLMSLPVGAATTLAVILHEIPQEIGDFGILRQAGFSRARALFYNYLSALLARAGTVIALLVGDKVESFSAVMLPFTAGGFVYIAGSDLLPELNREIEPAKSAVQLIAMGAGVGLMPLLTALE
jgi:zinc and cadmium transporter